MYRFLNLFVVVVSDFFLLFHFACFRLEDKSHVCFVALKYFPQCWSESMCPVGICRTDEWIAMSGSLD